MSNLSIVMPYLNEKDEVLNTINSIYDTADIEDFEIIVIDDGSKDVYDFSNYDKVKYFRNKKRIGVDGSRQKGVKKSSFDNIFIIDAHMRFKKDQWMSKIVECIEREPQTIWCTVCLGLGYGTMDINKPKGKYYGADLLIFNDKASKNRPSRECLEPKWTSFKEGLEYEVQCVLGANYGFSKKWFDHIRGLKGLKMWGSSEPFLSLKSWLAGGKCKIRTDIEIGHKFRSNAPYSTDISSLYANKIFIALTIFPYEIGKKIIDCLPKDINYKKAREIIKEERQEIVKDMLYYRSIFKCSIYDFFKKFNISF